MKRSAAGRFLMTALVEPAREKRQRTARRRIRKEVRRAPMKLGVYTVPYFYVAYMWFVYKTSRVEELGYRPDLVRAERGRGIYALWHDEVFFVASALLLHSVHETGRHLQVPILVGVAGPDGLPVGIGQEAAHSGIACFPAVPTNNPGDVRRADG